MAENKNKKVLNVPNKRELTPNTFDTAEHKEVRLKRNVPNLRFKEFEGEWKECRLGEIMNFSEKRINASTLTTSNYISTENMLQDFQGVIEAKSVPNNTNVISFTYGDILISNIRPYLKKVWKASIDGGCSSDVLVMKANDKINNDYLHYVIANNRFINFVMNGSKGVKMPRGDKEQMKTYIISLPPMVKEQNKIATFLSLLDERIATQNKIIDKLESLIKGIRKDIFKRLRKDFGFNSVIGSVLKYEQPQQYIVNDTEYTTAGIPVLTANKAFILGYTTEKQGIYDKGDCIIFDDFTLDCKYVNFPFKIKSSAIKILTAQSNAVLRYTFEYLKYINLSTEEHKRHYIAEVQNENFILPDTQTIESIARLFGLLTLQKDNAYKQKELFESEKQYLLRQMFI